MMIETEYTPNPNVLKFNVGRDVMGHQSPQHIKKGFDASFYPLADRLLKIQGVEDVFLGKDFVSVGKHPACDFNVLSPAIIGVILDHLEHDLPIANPQIFESHCIADDPLVQQIKDIIDQKVRPAVAQDGGDIVFDSFVNGIVYVRMYGACSGCPSSTSTLKAGIENMLKHYVPEVKDVQQIII